MYSGLYLLWKIGIAHSDVSLSNMLYYMRDDEPVGVLNDFDLAAIMNIGGRTPAKAGLERTGTIPFMALDLLDFPNGEIGRWFRHDLESTTWCLAWQMVIERPKKWYEGDFESIRQVRKLLMEEIDDSMVKSEWQTRFDFLKECFLKWEDLRRLVMQKVSKGPEKLKRRIKEYRETLDANLLRRDAEMARKVEIVEVLKDLSWIDVIVEGA